MKKVGKTLAPRLPEIARKKLTQGGTHKNKKAYKRKEKHHGREISRPYFLSLINDPHIRKDGGKLELIFCHLLRRESVDGDFHRFAGENFLREGKICTEGQAIKKLFD